MYPLEYEKSESVFDHNSVSKYTVFHIQILCNLCTYVCLSRLFTMAGTQWGGINSEEAVKSF